MPHSRREFLREAAALWAAAALRAHEHEHPQSADERSLYSFAFLDGQERKTLRTLMDRIVPADDRSSGALGACVDEYVDFILVHADAPLQETWRKGLKRYGQAVAGTGANEVDKFLAQQARNEFEPATDNETFFILLKAAVTEGFYTSKEGIVNELGYKGMAFVLDFQGCSHASHHVPEGWHPMLRDRKES
jgi:hypothetical protein